MLLKPINVCELLGDPLGQPDVTQPEDESEDESEDGVAQAGMSPYLRPGASVFQIVSTV